MEHARRTIGMDEGNALPKQHFARAPDRVVALALGGKTISSDVG